ncbi:sigma 54-interacting transcriptional regulator [Sorangium sp. So ce1097]|uniref:sigma 54-interacting transcriptional regulator n=1 Tax=Sorangium sp. So ce1097 TaxID=3133330 RepID=UPI003F5DFBB0
MSSPPIPTSGADATTVLKVRPREVAFGKFSVRVVSGPDQGAVQVADSPELSIGTAAGNHLVLSDPSVSRHHCVITATPKGYLLRDLDSTNGITLAGFRVGTAYLTPGATFGVGQTLLHFDHLPEEEVREPLGDAELSGRVLGQSTAMRRLFAMIPRIAASDATVLIEGETGAGKGLLAEVLHQQSARAAGPFVVIDCGAIPPTLIEAELFGHVKGAFTGALQARAGTFEAARGGTVLLDEIGELRLDLQPKLLRALEERSIRRIGSLDTVPLDVRIIAATNRDLRQEVNRGTFRSDLFYRLNVVRLRVPSLRERREDIPLLVAHYYRQFADRADPPAELVERLVHHDWPGNVRELRSAVERAVLTGDPAIGEGGVAGPREGGDDEGALRPDDLELSFRQAKERTVSRWERAYVKALIRANGGNLSHAARAGRMDRNHLRELLRRHGVTASES